MGVAPKCHFYWDSQVKSPKIPKIGTLTTLDVHNFFCKPLIKVRSKAKLELSSKAFQRYVTRPFHACKLGKLLNFNGRESKWQIDSWPLFLSHNLCYKYLNGSCEPILDIYVLRIFQWYKEIFNPMNFNLSNCYLKNWDSIRTPTPKMGVHLGVCGPIPSYFPTFTFLGMWM